MNALVHIPKNGGTTIRNLFSPYKPIWEKHACLQEIHDTIGSAEFERVRYLAIVRNPWSRLYSWWKFHRQTKQLAEYRCDFTEWLLKWCPHHWTNSPHFGGKHGLRYDAYVYAPTNQRAFVTVNGVVPSNVKVMRLEDMEDQWESVCEFYGQAVPMRTDNRSAKRDEWRKKYTKATKEIVRKLCKTDMDWLDYEI